jgi:chromate transporter
VKAYLELIITFFKIGIMTFGGGYAMLPIIQREVVEKKQWATEAEILDYYAIGQCTPGIIAVNTATFIGNKQKGVLGGFLATFGLVFPSLIIISVIAAVLTNFAEIAAVQHALAGIRVAVVVLVGYSVKKLAKSGVRGAFGWCLFVLTFLVSALFGASPVLVVVLAAVAGILAGILGKGGKQA